MFFWSTFFTLICSFKAHPAYDVLSTDKEMVRMALREEILLKAVEGGPEITPEWVAFQTTRIYRVYRNKGRSHDDSLKMAKLEMLLIKEEALRIRKTDRRKRMTDIAAWCVVILGVLACIGWWLLWE